MCEEVAGVVSSNSVAGHGRQESLWRRLEAAMLLPQSRIGTGGNYVHALWIPLAAVRSVRSLQVTSATVLDGLSSGLAGLVTRLASIVAEPPGGCHETAADKVRALALECDPCGAHCRAQAVKVPATLRCR